MTLAINEYFEPLGDYHYHQNNRSGFQEIYRELLGEDPRLAVGPILEVGCGGAFNHVISPLLSGRVDVDGVDPFEEVLGHSGLRMRWHGFFEEQNVPTATYSMVVAYNVVEHIVDAGPFLASVRRVLKPGGVFYALTPNAKHPFARLSRGIEKVGFKGLFSSHNKNVNDYPAYYRINQRKHIVEAAESLGFSAATFWYIPCAQWDQYFPRPLRFAPHLYDRLVGLRSKEMAAILVFRLEVPE